MINTAAKQFQKGIALLKHPLLPLVRIIQLLYLTGPFDEVEQILNELNEPIDTEGVHYDNPGPLLRPLLPILKKIEALKTHRAQSCIILDEDLAALDLFEAVDLQVTQQILEMELERINSLLCGPCGCTLCCTGPDAGMEQRFFEIPLDEQEKELFSLTQVDSQTSRQSNPQDEDPLQVDNRPFYESPPALYHWHSGWSLILPTDTACPNLDSATGGCTIYPRRPQVCRKPQIFPYALERSPEHDQSEEGTLPAFIARRKILAIWDCPYVRELKDLIANYAELCGMEPIFKQNKA